MIMRLIISSLLGGCFIVAAETLRVKKIISNETSRKIIHMAHGIVVAVWVFITSYDFIIAAEILFAIVVIGARSLNIMQPLRTVNRKSYGDIFFAFGVISVALLAPSRYVFLAAILHLALADALAALVGRRFKKGVYFVLGQRKTAAGTSTFFIVSLLIIFWLIRFGPSSYQLSVLLLTPLITTLAENISPYGSDNLTIPLVVACSLKFLF